MMMQPKYSTEFIEVNYWSCLRDGHRHKTESVARKCIEKRGEKKERKWNSENLKKALDMRGAHATDEEIATEFHVSAAYIRELLARYERRLHIMHDVDLGRERIDLDINKEKGLRDTRTFDPSEIGVGYPEKLP